MLKNRSSRVLILISNLLCGSFIQAAPPPSYGTLPETIHKITNNIGELRQRSHNLEIELNQVEQRCDNIESIVDTLRNQVADLTKAIKDQSDSSKVFIESRVGNLEHNTSRAFSDLQLVKNHVNDFSAVISQYKSQLQVLEQNSKQQNQNIENLQTALKILTEALQTSEEKDTFSDEYKVKAGDSLEKIAQTYGTTVKALKELNDLSSDRIKINQKLKIPEKKLPEK